MTLQDAINICYKTVSNNQDSAFSVKSIISDNSLITEDIEETKLILSAALKEMESNKILVPISEDKWVLRKKLNQYSQSLEISYDYASILVPQLNRFLKLTDAAGSDAEIGNLQHKDLITIYLAIKMANDLLAQAAEEIEE